MAKLIEQFDWLPVAEAVAYEAEDEAAAEEAVAALTAEDNTTDTTTQPEKDDAATDGEEVEEDGGEKPAATDADDGQDDPVQTDPEPDPKPEKAAEPTPDPAELKRIIDEAKAARKKAMESYDDGDISQEELDAELDRIAEESAPAMAQLKAAETKQAAAVDQWKQDGAAYIQANPALGKGDVFDAFNDAIKRVARSPRAQRGEMTNADVLTAAHKMLVAEAELLGIEVPAMEGADHEPKTEAKRTAPKGDDSLGKKVPTLAAAPANKVSDIDSDSPFAYLESLAKSDPIAYEEAYGKLSDQQREAYLKSDLGV